MPKQRVGDIELYYEVTGQGEPLVLIHGLGASTLDWEPQVEFFSRHYRVLAFDLRGYGRSDKPYGDYSIERLTRDTLGLLEALDFPRAHVVGLSLGGMIAFQLVVDAPERVKSLVIVNSGPAVPADTFKKRLPLYIRLVIIRLLGMRKMADVLSKKLFPKPEQEALRRSLCERVGRNDRKIYTATLKAIFAGWGVAEHLGRIECPALVVAADQDYTPVSLKESYASAMPRAEVAVIEDARHAVPLEKPQEFNEVVAEFLRRVDGLEAPALGESSERSVVS